MKSKILVIIVTYNAMRWVDRCLTSLRNASLHNDVFVIDNGSTDGTQSYIKENYPEVIFSQSDENLGFGRANNIGLKYALANKYEYVYLLNQDAWVSPDCFEVLINAFSKDRSFGILSPLQCQANGRHLDKMFLQCLADTRFLEFIYNNSLLDIDVDYPYQVGMTMAAHWMLPIETILKVGGFSPTFPHYGEDVNYVDRLRYWNLKMGVVPAATAVHDREFRPMPIEKKMYQYYMVELDVLSDPNPYSLPWIFTFAKRCIKFAYYDHRFDYIKYLWPLISKMRNIKENRVISMTERAFLD